MLHESTAYDNPIGYFSHFRSLCTGFYTKANTNWQS